MRGIVSFFCGAVLLLHVTLVNPSPDSSGGGMSSHYNSMANVKDNVTSTTASVTTSLSPTPAVTHVLAQEISWSGMTRPTSGSGSSSSPSHSLSSPQQGGQFGRVLLTGKSGHSTTIKSPSSHKNKSVFMGETHLHETFTEVKRSADESEFQMEPPDPPVSLASSSSSRNTGPYFESNRTVVHMTARAGQTVLFDCTVVLLQGRTVSWLRKRKDNLQLLTVGNATYYSDTRVGLRFRYPNNWRLGIEPVQKGDEGEYQCQLSTHPTKALIFHLKVIAPAVQILDENGHVVTERHYKVDSSLHLTCKASHVDKLQDNITWLKGPRPLPGGDSRIKVKLTKNTTSGEATAFLSVLSVRKGDSGNYTCRASSLASSTIAVHVLNGELPAAVQHENGGERRGTSSTTLLSTLLMYSVLSPTLHNLPFLYPSFPTTSYAS